MASTNGKILTLDEVAVYLESGKRTVYLLIQKGDIPSFRLGGSWCFRCAEQ
ncbi:MAG: excisionase family DNA-binding protein, partial [Pseudomonadales bacterium]|nr:excisionase family DNA-binding protein [Pseudomonadales bacterium]